MVYTHPMTTTATPALPTYYYVVLAAHTPACYGPYSTEVAAATDARRLALSDYYADVHPASALPAIRAFYAGHGQVMQERTPLAPR